MANLTFFQGLLLSAIYQSNPAQITSPPPPELKIEQQPVGFNGYTGGELNLSVIASNGTVFNLYKDDVQIKQNNNGQFIIDEGAPANSGSYYWIISNASGQSIQSDTVHVKVIDKPVEVDTDAQAYLTAESITEQPYVKAVNNLVKGLKATGLYEKVRGLYLYKGTTGRKNLVRAYAQYDLQPGGTTQGLDGRIVPFFDYDNHGAKMTYSYGKTGLSPSAIGELVSIISYNNRMTNSGQWEIGVFNDNGPSLAISKDQVRGGNTVFLNNIKEGVIAFNIYGTGARDYSVYYNKVKQATNADKVSVAGIANEMYVGAMNFNGSPAYSGGPSTCYYSAIMVGLTDAEYLMFYDLMDTFLTAYNVTPRMGRLFARGDSITMSIGVPEMLQAWIYRLGEKLNYEVFNEGVSGSTVQQMIEADIPTYQTDKPSWFFINYGTNDIYNTIEEEKAYYRTKINAVMAKGWPKERIVLNAGYYGSESRPEYPAIVQAILDIGQEFAIKAYDNRSIMAPAPDANFHPGPIASELLAEAYYQRLKDL